jgi:hypothetical protein
MSLRYPIILPGALLACLCACGGLELNPVVNEARTVHLEKDPSKTLTVLHDMVWSDKSHAAHRITFPAAIYALEAEDGDYWYMRSSLPLGYQEIGKGAPAERRNLRGGIAIGKYTTRSVPAAGYIDGQESTRILIWKLGKDFLSREGNDWRRSF